jgi:hypothetical protein
MVMQSDRDTGAGIYQQNGVAPVLGAVVGERERHPVHPEDPLVPSSPGRVEDLEGGLDPVGCLGDIGFGVGG